MQRWRRFHTSAHEWCDINCDHRIDNRHVKHVEHQQPGIDQHIVKHVGQYQYIDKQQ